MRRWETGIEGGKRPWVYCSRQVTWSVEGETAWENVKVNTLVWRDLEETWLYGWGRKLTEEKGGDAEKEQRYGSVSNLLSCVFCLTE